MNTISVIIPVYKNKEMFLKNLSINVPYLKDCEIIVVDDASGEQIAEEVESKFKNVIVVKRDKNEGFAKTVNVGIQKTKGTYIMLLNSDVVLSDASYLKALNHFKNKHVFAVSFAQKENNGQTVGKNRIYFKNGFIRHERVIDLSSGLNAWAEGGAAMFDKEKLAVLSNFDQIYSPFYWEDIDLSYRAYKRTWSVLFDPAIIVEHHHESTIGKYFSQNKIKTIAYRNHFMFMWINISDRALLAQHFNQVMIGFIQAITRRDYSYIFGLLAAINKIPEVLHSRYSASKQWRLSDNEVLSLFQKQ